MMETNHILWNNLFCTNHMTLAVFTHALQSFYSFYTVFLDVNSPGIASFDSFVPHSHFS